MMVDIAKAGGGIGIFPEPMVCADMTRGDLVELDGMPALAPVEFHVAMRSSDHEPLTTKIFERASQLRLDQQSR